MCILLFSPVKNKLDKKLMLFVKNITNAIKNIY